MDDTAWPTPELAALRDEIDALDAEVVARLNRRAELAVAVGQLKRARQRPIYDPERERALLDRLSERNGGPLSDEAIRSIYRRIVQACRNLEAAPKVACLGPRGTFSHQAALMFAGPGIDVEPLADLPDVAEAVHRGEVELGMLPVENSIEGVIGTTFDLVVEHNLHVVGELVLPVHLHLVGAGPLETVGVVYSHPQPLRQARHWLRGHVPRAELRPVSSTAEAAQRAASEAGAAAIVGPMLLEEGELAPLAGPIEDRPDNRTRFWAVARAPRREGRKSTLMLTLPHRPGSLAQALNVLAAAGINLTSIGSRPARAQPWEYRFFVDMDGDAAQPPIREAIQQLTNEGVHVRVLGVYEPAEEPA